MTKQIWLNLPVKEVAKSKEFFAKIGFSFNEQYATPHSTCLSVGATHFAVMLFEEAIFEGFVLNKITDTQSSSELLISIDAESREEVDEFAKKVEEAGGTVFSKPAEIQGWMYGCGFADLDGHRWNMLYMDFSKVPKQYDLSQFKKHKMTTLEFKIEINAPKEKVWDVLWNEETYKQWTSVFCEGTYAVSDWKEGSKIQFLSPNGDGMNSVIYKKIDNEYMAFKHLSEIKKFQEMPVDDATQEWAGAMEMYRLTEDIGITVLEAKMDSVEKYIDYFKTTWPKALDLVKKLSEGK